MQHLWNQIQSIILIQPINNRNNLLIYFLFPVTFMDVLVLSTLFSVFILSWYVHSLLKYKLLFLNSFSNQKKWKTIAAAAIEMNLGRDLIRNILVQFPVLNHLLQAHIITQITNTALLVRHPPYILVDILLLLVIQVSLKCWYSCRFRQQAVLVCTKRSRDHLVSYKCTSNWGENIWETRNSYYYRH